VRTLVAVGCLTAFIATLGLEDARAQVDRGLTDQELIDPWQRAKAVVVSLEPLLKATSGKEQRGRLDAELSKLDEQLSELQAELEKVAIRIVTVPEFAYEASNKSSELSAQVLDIEKSFDALFAELNVRERSDVDAMRSSMSSLRETLHKQGRFERDMVRAIASGSKNEMQALAGQWWRVGESVESVKLAVPDLRAQPATATNSETKE